MEDIKKTYTVAGKEFDNYDEAIAYKEKVNKEKTYKQEVIDGIKKRHKALLDELDNYQVEFPTDEDKNDLLKALDIFDDNDTISISFNTEALDKLEDKIKDLLKVLGL